MEWVRPSGEPRGLGRTDNRAAAAVRAKLEPLCVPYEVEVASLEAGLGDVALEATGGRAEPVRVATAAIGRDRSLLWKNCPLRSARCCTNGYMARKRSARKIATHSF